MNEKMDEEEDVERTMRRMNQATNTATSSRRSQTVKEHTGHVTGSIPRIMVTRDSHTAIETTDGRQRHGGQNSPEKAEVKAAVPRRRTTEEACQKELR